MNKVVDMDGKPHTGEGTPNFPEWAKFVDQHMREVNLLLDELVEAHNRMADRILELERQKSTPKQSLWRGFHNFMLWVEEHAP